MAQVSSTLDKTAENGAEENPEKPRSRMQRSRSCLLKAVSYFAGDMEPFAKWMQSIATLYCTSGRRCAVTSGIFELHFARGHTCNTSAHCLIFIFFLNQICISEFVLALTLSSRTVFPSSAAGLGPAWSRSGHVRQQPPERPGHFRRPDPPELLVGPQRFRGNTLCHYFCPYNAAKQVGPLTRTCQTSE